MDVLFAFFGVDRISSAILSETTADTTMTYWPVFAAIVLGAIFGFGWALRAYPKETIAIFSGCILLVGFFSHDSQIAFFGGIPLGFLVLLVFAGYKSYDS